MKSENGQTALEYALILAGVALVMAAFLVGFGTGILDSASAAALELLT